MILHIILIVIWAEVRALKKQVQHKRKKIRNHCCRILTLHSLFPMKSFFFMLYGLVFLTHYSQIFSTSLSTQIHTPSFSLIRKQTSKMIIRKKRQTNQNKTKQTNRKKEPQRKSTQHNTESHIRTEMFH